jgi:hypothetical protein
MLFTGLHEKTGLRQYPPRSRENKSQPQCQTVVSTPPSSARPAFDRRDGG